MFDRLILLFVLSRLIIGVMMAGFPFLTLLSSNRIMNDFGVFFILERLCKKDFGIIEGCLLFPFVK